MPICIPNSLVPSRASEQGGGPGGGERLIIDSGDKV